MTEEEQEKLNQELYEVVESGRPIAEIKKIVAKGADINGGNGYDTPLIVATQRGNVETVKFLIRAGADVNMEDKFGKTALRYACESPDKIGDEYRWDVSDKWGEIRYFSMDKQKVKLLLEAGANMSIYVGEEGEYDSGAYLPRLLLETNDPEIMEHVMDSNILLEGNDRWFVKKHIEMRKEAMKKARKHRKEYLKAHPDEKISGVALADEIARDVISGKEKRTITPEVGIAIKRKKAFAK